MDKKLLDHYYAGKFKVPVALPNRNFEPSEMKLKYWAELTDMPNGARKETLECTRRQGIFQITLFMPLNEDTETLHAKADQILDYYGVEKEHALEDGSTLYVMSSYKTRGLPDGAWFMLPITIDYHIIKHQT